MSESYWNVLCRSVTAIEMRVVLRRDTCPALLQVCGTSLARLRAGRKHVAPHSLTRTSEGKNQTQSPAQCGHSQKSTHLDQAGQAAHTLVAKRRGREAIWAVEKRMVALRRPPCARELRMFGVPHLSRPRQVPGAARVHARTVYAPSFLPKQRRTAEPLTVQTPSRGLR